MNPVECYTSGCKPSSCRTAWDRMEKLHRLWRSLRKTSRESKLEKTDAFWELELNVSFQQASKGSVTDQLLWLAQSFTSVSSEVKKMLKIREYFLAYGLGQLSNSRSVFAFIRSSTSLFFTQILFVVTNDIQKKLGKKKRSRSLSPKWLRELSERQRNCSPKLSVTWLLKCSLYSLYGYRFVATFHHIVGFQPNRRSITRIVCWLAL